MVKGPHNVCIPCLELHLPCLPTTSLLKLLRGGEAVLVVDNHETSILDFLPLLGPFLQQPVPPVNWCQAHLLALLDIDQLNELFLDSLDNVLL